VPKYREKSTNARFIVPNIRSTELGLTATPKHLPEEIGIAEKNGMSRYDKALHTQPASSTGQVTSSSN
jgi:hypothetical protein